jgi:hypothetical protein
MCELSGIVFGISVDKPALRLYAIEALRIGSTQYGGREVAVWADGFKIDPAIVDADV